MSKWNYITIHMQLRPMAFILLLAIGINASNPVISGPAVAQIDNNANPNYFSSFPEHPTLEPLLFYDVTDNGKIIIDIRSIIIGSTETFDLSFKDALSSIPLKDVDFDFIIKKDNNVIYKGSDSHNNGKPLYTNNGNYTIKFTFPTAGVYYFEIPIYKVGTEKQNTEDSIIKFWYTVTYI